MVVTIVVLLILAGVSISLILDNNGIIQKSKDARKEYRQAQTNEQADLESISNFIEEIEEESKPKVIEPKNIEDWEYTEEDDGTITINSYKGNDITVIIPNYINGKPVKKTEIKEDSSTRTLWLNCTNTQYGKKQQTIKEVIISDGIEEIGDFTFVRSEALEKVTIPRSVKILGNNVFAGCFNLSSITIPNNVISIGAYVFTGCTGLTNITIPSSVTSIGKNVFSDIQSITVNVPFKEGDTPEGWNADWNFTSNSYNVTVNYLK